MIIFGIPNTSFILNNFRRNFANINKIGIKKLYVAISNFALFFLYSFYKNVDTFFYDSSSYWQLADGMFANGKFDLYAFPETFRCYFIHLVI